MDTGSPQKMRPNMESIPMSQDVVLAETRGPVALVTLNRPQKLNALDYALIDRLMAVLDIIETDDDVLAVVLTGAGERAFSSGRNIAFFAPSVRRGPAAGLRAVRGRAAALRDCVRRGQRLTGRIESFPKPIIVAVNGLAHGGGGESVEAAPLAIARERAEFRKPEINRGVAPPFGGP